MTLPETHGRVRNTYIDHPEGQLHARYVAPPQGQRRHRPVLLCGPAPSSAKMFKELLGQLGTDRVAIAFDNPGSGESTPPSRPFEQSRQFADLYAMALDKLGLGVVDAFGDHSGAMMALALAAFHPRQVAHVMSVSAPFVTDARSRAEWRSRATTITEPEPLQKALESAAKSLDSLPPGLTLARAIEMSADGLATGVRRNWQILSSFAEGQAEMLARITAPVVFLQVADMLRDANLDASRHVRRAVVRERPDLSQMAMVTAAPEFAREIRAAFDG